ncbi:MULTISPECIES: outer membrane protein [unclassified Bradyrhizobium]|uniref:outer membrane protein n=1 Tax=unclassified Bradyrhizobium TaxID=2631580 RepID=UPI0029168475|nr:MULTISPECIES: outer membrane beta-barrel protein [unclassified Bradyrhizobium]
MRRLLFANVAALAMATAGSAAAADLAVAPPASFAARFNWTSCYGGLHLGGGFATKNVTDPVQLVQDSFIAPGSTVGVTTVNPGPSGVVIGGQIGCDYQFSGSSVVVGIEGAASGSTMKANKTVALPLSIPDVATVQANTDFLSSVTARVGYAFDNMLVYAKAGGALAGDKYEVSGTFGGVPYDFRGLENRFGWTAGAGVDWAFAQHWSANFEYDYYGFGHGTVNMTDPLTGFSGPVTIGQSIQVVKVGLNFHMWGAGL